MDILNSIYFGDNHSRHGNARVKLLHTKAESKF